MTEDHALSAAGEDADGLADGLAGLAALVYGSDTLEMLLTKVANFAVVAVPGADGAGVTMQQLGEPDTIVASSPFVSDVDRVQYRLGEGPCISAAATGKTTGSGALGEDRAWPRFGPMAAHLGVHSAVSLPLVLDDKILGALNVYSHQRDAFDESSRHIGEHFAGPAAVAIHNAQVLEQTRHETARHQFALTSRSMIDRAVGIVMATSGISADDAFIRLRIMSQLRHTTVANVATRLIHDTVQQALDREPRPDGTA